MSKRQKLLTKALNSQANFAFKDFVNLIEAFGFELDHIRGSHQQFVHPATTVKVNIQDDDGQAKPYQLRQFLKLIEQNNLKLKD